MGTIVIFKLGSKGDRGQWLGEPSQDRCGTKSLEILIYGAVAQFLFLVMFVQIKPCGILGTVYRNNSGSGSGTSCSGDLLTI